MLFVLCKLPAYNTGAVQQECIIDIFSHYELGVCLSGVDFAYKSVIIFFLVGIYNTYFLMYG